MRFHRRRSSLALEGEERWIEENADAVGLGFYTDQFIGNARVSFSEVLRVYTDHYAKDDGSKMNVAGDTTLEADLVRFLIDGASSSRHLCSVSEKACGLEGVRAARVNAAVRFSTSRVHDCGLE